MLECLFLALCISEPPPPPNRFVCLPQRVQPLSSLRPCLAFAASSFVSISLFPLPHLQFPPLLSINLFCFPSHWSRVPFPQSRSLSLLVPFLLGTFLHLFQFVSSETALYTFLILTFHPFVLSVLNIKSTHLCNSCLCLPLSTVADKGQTPYSCLKCLTWCKELHVWNLCKFRSTNTSKHNLIICKYRTDGKHNECKARNHMQKLKIKKLHKLVTNKEHQTGYIQIINIRLLYFVWPVSATLSTSWFLLTLLGFVQSLQTLKHIT